MPLRLLLACDLDRTVLPNGPEPLAPGAMEAFAAFVNRPEIHLAYASGRDLPLIQQALADYHIPLPHTAIGDVGTSVYRQNNGHFMLDSGWSAVIAPDWHSFTGQQIHQFLSDLPQLKLQETTKQNTFKLSYYTPVDVNKTELIDKIQTILQPKHINAAVIFSIDQIAQTGLVDIIPANATKQQAVDYVRSSLGLMVDQVVYAGDSGNDLEPLTCGYKAILVHNALPSVKEEVKKLAEKKGVQDKMYYTEGNYVSGILEGLRKFGYY